MLQPLAGVLECEAHFPGDYLSIVEEELLFMLPVLRLGLSTLPTLPGSAQLDLYLHTLPEAKAASSSRSRLSSQALRSGAALRKDQWAGLAARRGPVTTACFTRREQGRQSQLGTPSTEHRSPAPASPKWT